MKESSREFVLLVLFNLLIAGSMGCATLYTASAISSGKKTHDIPVLTDEIIAIGRPDPILVRKLGQKNAVAFLGLKHTYMLFKGGEELEQVAQGDLEDSRIMLDTSSAHLYLKDKQVWGSLFLTYNPVRGISQREQETLNKLGFSPRKTDGQNIFWKGVYIEGMLYPAIKLSPQQDALKSRRPFTLYSSQSVQAPTNYAAVALLPLAVATDIVLTPVYLGIGLIAITAATVSH